MNAVPLYIDATMLYRWHHLAPVGIVRLERLLAAHLRFRSAIGRAEYVVWDNGYRRADATESQLLDALLDGSLVTENDGTPSEHVGTPIDRQRSGVIPAVRRAGLRTIDRFPDHLRPFAEQAAWSAATLAVESARHARRRWTERGVAPRRATSDVVDHRIDLSQGADLVALGLGWEYLDHEAMYLLRRDHGVRIHMPAFDLIPVTMPQMNAGQSHLVHRYYAEMAHYADTITCISHATEAALRKFYLDEGLPVPHLTTNQLPGMDRPQEHHSAPPTVRRHRLDGKPFVLSVSTVEIRKNHLMLAKVWAECAREGTELPQLAIVGRVGWDVGELLQWVLHAPELDDRVAICTDVEDDELVHMYGDALFTVFPSRVEGWGLPITESLSYGKACVHSTDPAQMEASQGLMPALHPDDFVSWKREIVRIASDSSHRDALERAIRERYVRRTPTEYCARFEEVLTGRRSAPA